MAMKRFFYYFNQRLVYAIAQVERTINECRWMWNRNLILKQKLFHGAFSENYLNEIVLLARTHTHTRTHTRVWFQTEERTKDYGMELCWFALIIAHEEKEEEEEWSGNNDGMHSTVNTYILHIFILWLFRGWITHHHITWSLNSYIYL